MKFPFSVLLAMSLIACGEEEKEEVDPLTVDDDGDGFSEEQGDCDDTNADLSPGATEVCDEIDNDCDGDIDDADSSVDLETGSVFYADEDGDGFGSMTEIAACVLPEGAVENMDDCDDDNADVNPDGSEVCDEIDNDCDGDVDDADDSLDTSTGSTFYTDSDGDGEGDADASVMACTLPEGAVENMSDCDDTDAALNNADVDADGFATCPDADGFVDCDDTGATELTNSSLDGDCDGTLTADDCDDNDAMSTIMADDMDCDGLLPVENGGTDCDDMDATIGATDADGDGSLACDGDCDDNDASLYPGVAFNEADPTLCAADADGDGYANYAGFMAVSCVDVNMVDSYGDGWNGNAITVYEDGVETGSYANDSSYSGGAVHTETHCFDSATTMVEFEFVDGSWNNEVFFTISDNSSGVVFGSAQGGSSSSNEITWEGTTFIDGDVFFDIADVSAVEMLTGGSDCDDTDATTFGDDDGDGATYCTTDCDDTDATLNADDLDMDGFSSCDGDCDDTPGSCDDGVSTNETDCTTGSCDDGVSTTETDCTAASAVWTAGGTWTAGGSDFNPGMTETWYDGVDSDCSGGSDYDQDGDGYEVIEYDDGTGTMVVHGGTDCYDSSASYTPLAMEADPTACYYDYDQDGYGDDTPSTTAEGYGVIAGTDCYDFSDVIYPGAAYMEADVDGDGMDDCTRDADGDGWGNNAPASYYNAAAGTDCDDSDELLAPDIDTDGDGVSVCDDCDDDDSTAQGGYLYSDDDGDGEGDVDDMGTLVCDMTDLDSDDDGTNDMSLTNMDCDDGDATTVGDDDGDGFYSCDDDCDDTDEFTFPGAGFNEAGALAMECLTDADGDGYAYGFNNPFNAGACLDIDMVDSYGDGWNGNAIEIYEDGTLTGTYANDSSYAGGASHIETHCLDVNSMTVEFVFVDGSFNNEVSFSITDTTDGTVLGSATGSGTYDLVWDGMTYTDGDTFLALGSLGGTDTNDSDASVW